jgi:hypothetical protein
MCTFDNASFVPRENCNYSGTLVSSKNVTVPNHCIYGVHGFYALCICDFRNSVLVGNRSVPLSTNFGSSTTAANWDALVCRLWYIKNLVKGNASFESIDYNM